jgi:predicted nucleic acid-binding protein
VSEDDGAVPPSYVPDVSALIAIARGDARVMSLVQELDAKGWPLIVPALALAAASLDSRSDEADELLEGLELFENVTIASLQDAEQALALAAVIARTGLDPWDAHVAMVADSQVCPVLTLDAAKWRPHLGDLDEPLHIVEIADPDEG